MRTCAVSDAIHRPTGGDVSPGGHDGIRGQLGGDKLGQVAGFAQTPFCEDLADVHAPAELRWERRLAR
jgi:hypothetical protein